MIARQQPWTNQKNLDTMRKTIEKHDILILRRYLGTTMCHDGTQNCFKKKFDTSALK